jgi:hypothetical protein
MTLSFNTYPRRIWGSSRGRSCLDFPVKEVLLYQSLKMIKYKCESTVFTIVL